MILRKVKLIMAAMTCFITVVSSAEAQFDDKFETDSMGNFETVEVQENASISAMNNVRSLSAISGQTSYDLEITARKGTALGSLNPTAFGFPSINDSESISFVMRDDSGRSDGTLITLSDKGIFGLSFAQPFPATMSDYSQINDQGRVIWHQGFTDGLVTFVQRLESNAGGQTLGSGSYTPVWEAPFDEVLPWVSMNDSGRGVFSALLNGGTLLASRDSGSGNYTQTVPLSGYPSFFPMISNDNRIIVRGGATSTAPIVLFTDETFSSNLGLATSSGFNEIGDKPGISDDGRVSVFMANSLTEGRGVFVTTLNSSFQGYQFKLVDVPAGSPLSFRVGVNQAGTGEFDYRVVYLAESSGVLGLYSRDVDVTNPAAPVADDPVLVTQLGDTIDGLTGVVNYINVYDPVNNSGQVVFRVKTTAGEEAIVKAVSGGRVIWSSGQPIKGAVIEAYYCKGTNIDDIEIVPIPAADPSNPTKTDVSGRFVVPSEFFDFPVAVGDGEIEGKRGIRAKVTYKDITDQAEVGTNYTIINYPDWDPFYPFYRVGLGSEIVFPNPVFFQPGTQSVVNSGHEDADGKLRIFLNLDVGLTKDAINTLAQSYTQVDTDPTTWSEAEWRDHLTTWLNLKRGITPQTRIPAFILFTIPSKQGDKACHVVKSDNVDWGYNNCWLQSEDRVQESYVAVKNHFNNHIKPAITDLSPNDVDDIPFNITAHSLGGIISRDWLARREVNGDLYPKVNRYVTFDSPHGGVKFDNFFAETLRKLARVFLQDFWSEAAMNGTSPDLNTKAVKKGWNNSRNLQGILTGDDVLLLSSPDNEFMAPEEDPEMQHGVTWSGSPGTVWGVGRVIKSWGLTYFKRFSSTSNGYCKRYVDGWQLAVKDADHGIQAYAPSMLSAARFLAYGNPPFIGTTTDPLIEDFKAVKGEGTGDQCPDTGGAPVVKPAIFKKILTAPVGGSVDELVYFDASESLHVEGFLTHEDAHVTVLNEAGTEISKSNMVQQPIEEGSVAFAFDINVSPGAGTLRLTAGAEDAMANVTISYGDNYYAAVGTQEDQYLAGGTVNLKVQLMNWSDLVVYGAGGTADVLVTKPDATQVTINLFDDGTHGDDVAGDGTYAGEFSDTVEIGRYYTRGDITIELGGGIFVRRTADSFFAIETLVQSTEQDITEQAVDADGNGFEDFIDVTYQLNFTGTGNFALQADVMNGLDIVHKAKEVFEVASAPSTQVVTFRIPAEVFRKENTGGPLTITNVDLFENDHSLYMNSFADHATSAYQVSDFELPPMPVVTYCMPSYANYAGGDTVLIQGENLDMVTDVYFGAQPATSFEIVSDKVISAVVPPWDGGKENVLIKVVDPWHEATRSGIFDYTQVNHEPQFQNIGDQMVTENELLEFTVTATDPDGDPLTMSARMADGDDLLTIGADFQMVLLGDINDDGVVNVGDLALLKASFFSTKGDARYNPRADFDNSGVINVADLAVLKANFFKTTSNGTMVGLFTWTPDMGQAGEYEVEFEASDGQLTATELVHILVIAATP